MKESERRERQAGETARQTGKRSGFCLFPLQGDWERPGGRLANHGRIQTGLDQSEPLQWEASACCCSLTAVQSNHNSMVTGFSRNLRNSASHCAPTAPSTTRWSQLSVTDIMLATSNLQKNPKRNLHQICFCFLNAECSTCYSIIVMTLTLSIISRHQPFLWASDGEDTGLRRVDYRWEVLDAEHPQIRDCERPSLVEKTHTEEDHFNLLVHKIHEICIKLKLPHTRPRDQKTCLTWNSCGCSLPSLALAARDDTSELMAASPLMWALNTMGVMRPLAVLTATLRSTTWFLEKIEISQYWWRHRNLVNVTFVSKLRRDEKMSVLWVPSADTTVQLHL